MNQLMTIDGVSVRRDLEGRYCLNDLHRAAGAFDKHKPAFWLRNEQAVQLVTELQISNSPMEQPVQVIRGGNEQGTYVCKELVYAYAMWISASFSLKVIRTFDSAVSEPNPVTNLSADKMKAGVILIEFMRKELNLSNSSVLGACKKLQDAVGLPNLTPQYAIDAPAGAMDGSSRSTQSLSTILKNNNIPLTANQAYHQLAKLGIVDQKTRPSRSSATGEKKFWSLTAKGCMYGKNMTSLGNPRETQPHFFESKAAELLRLMDTAH
jgi:hypothetical protein